VGAEVAGGEVVLKEDAGSAAHFLGVVDGMAASENHGDALAAEENRFPGGVTEPGVSATIPVVA